MNNKARLIAVSLVFISCTCCLPRVAEAGHAVLDVQENWQLGMQAWSFNRFTFYEAVDKTAALGLSYIEAYPGQPLSKEKPNMKFHHMMPVEIREEVKQKLKDAGVKVVNYGVVGLPNNEAECRKVFDFAKDMGIETIVSEPPADALDLIERLCEECKIKMAIHNHPKPSRYWHPDRVLMVCKGRSKWIGACADTGHWLRSGLDPVESLKKLEGHIISLHFKDVIDGHDCIWGTGKCNVKEMLAELNRQNFKGMFSIEYEYHWENSMPEISKCIQYFDQLAVKLGQARWQWLLNGLDLTGWTAKPGSWVVQPGGLLFVKGGGNIWTKERFDDFILDLEFKVAKGSNSGVFLRANDTQSKDWWQKTIEVQIHDTTDGYQYGQCGAIYNCMPPSKNMVKPTGEWNHCTITCKANKIYVVLNGEQIIDMDLNRWTEAHKNPDGTRNKFNTAYKDMPRVGHIGLQDHGDPVWFRNIKIKPLSKGLPQFIPIDKDLSAWEVKGDKSKSKWTVGIAAMSTENPKMLVVKKGEGEMINLPTHHSDSVDIYSKAKFGDCRIELELMVPKGSNSGIYVMGEYEIQVLDSYGKEKMDSGDMGAIYGAAPPPVNACKRPGEWQKYVIEFRAPKFDANGKKIANAEFIKVELNGQVLHENLEMPGPTPAGLTGREAPIGPIMFQGNHGPVAYRNIKIEPLDR